MRRWQDVQQSIRNCPTCQREEGTVFAPFPFFNETLCLTIIPFRIIKDRYESDNAKNF